jgi:photosystem II stability/assembly factor-like uncharacterized protein
MNKLYWIVGLLLLVACEQSDKQEKEKDFSAYGPAEYLWERWAYPNENVDQAYFNKLLKEENAALANKDNQNEVSWRMEGPLNIGGRINCIALNPDDEEEIWIGTSAGGVFRSYNMGDDWEAIGESFAYMSIGSIAFDPSNTNVVYVGSGDPNISGYPSTGDGVYKTEDGGSTWEHMGPSEVGVVSKILVDPFSPETVYMASMGTPWFENEHRGVYKSIDGGVSWDQVLYLSDQAGISSLVFHPSTPDTLYAAGWDRIRSNTQSIVSGDHSRIYRSYDGGTSWDTLSGGLPMEFLSRAAVDVSLSDPNVLYASFVDGDNFQMYGVYKSEDYGDTWTATNISNLDGALGGFGWYFGMIRIKPTNDNIVSVAGVELHSTQNGGVSFNQSTPDWWTYEVHADMHDLVYATSGDIYLATDGGLYHSTNDMATWEYISYLPITQFYRISVDPFNDEIYSGGAQDNGTMAGNFENQDSWPRIYGGDGFQSLYDPNNELRFYACTQNGNINVSNGGFWDDFTIGINGDERVAWDVPLIMSHFDSEVLYTATTKVYRNEGGIWDPISDDLNASEDFYPANRHIVSTVAESPLNENVLYAGTSDGKVWVTTNLGSSWTDITSGLPDRYVTNIKASPTEEGSVFVCHSGYRDGDNVPHIFRSDDYGQNWIAVAGDLPDFGLNHIEILNDHMDSIMFVASDGGVYYTSNSGANWDRVGDNMPTIIVYDIEVDYDANRLVAGTFARSMQSVSLDSLLDFSTSVKELAAFHFSLYPNPVVSELRIDLPSNADQMQWKIMDLNGKIIKQGNTGERVISVDALPSGVYFLSLENERGRKVRKWVKG